jgi:hypothetical protein
MSARPWTADRAAAVALRIAAWLFEKRQEYSDSASDIATEVGRASHRLESEAGFHEMLHELLPWTCCEERVERAVKEVYGVTMAEELPTVEAPTRREPRRVDNHCVVANVNTFFTPGGVEPEKWRTR